MLHVSNGESSEGRIFSEGLNAHGLGGNKLNHSGVTGLDELGLLFDGSSSSSVVLGHDFLELAGDVGGVAIQHWAVSVLDLSGVVDDDDLSVEAVAFPGGVVLLVGADESSLEVLDGNILDVEADVISGDGLGEGLVVHFD